MNGKRLSLFLVPLLIGCILVTTGTAGAAGLTVGGDEAKVGFLAGGAEVRPKDKGDWLPLKLDMTLGEGDLVRTGVETRMELILPDKSRMRFAGGSEFRVIRMAGGGTAAPRDIRIHLVLGKAWSRIAQILGMKGNVDLFSDRAVVGVRGTVYRMNVDPDRSVLVRVYDGAVYVSGGQDPQRPSPVGPPDKVAGPRPIAGPHRVTMEEWTLIIKAMQQVRIGADGTPEKPREFTEAEDRDEWVDWNRKRDRDIGYR